MQIEQFVVAYSVDQDRLGAILPDGFSSLRPVLRINAEIHNCRFGYIEFNTAVEKDGIKGWLNIGSWNDVFLREKKRLLSSKQNSLNCHSREWESRVLARLKKIITVAIF